MADIQTEFEKVTKTATGDNLERFFGQLETLQTDERIKKAKYYYIAAKSMEGGDAEAVTRGLRTLLENSVLNLLKDRRYDQAQDAMSSWLDGEIIQRQVSLAKSVHSKGDSIDTVTFQRRFAR